MPETSSRGLHCPWTGQKCGPNCAWFDRVLDTCCVRAINDHLRSMYEGDAMPPDRSQCAFCMGKGWYVETKGDVSKVVRCQHGQD